MDVGNLSLRRPWSNCCLVYSAGLGNLNQLDRGLWDCCYNLEVTVLSRLRFWNLNSSRRRRYPVSAMLSIAVVDAPFWKVVLSFRSLPLGVLCLL